MVSSTIYLPAGTVLNNKYKITSSLPGGGFGQAYKARDITKEIKGSVLIKQLKPQKNEVVLKIAREKFQEEAKVLKLLGERHPQIPKLFDYFEEEKEFYTAQQYIDGLDLEKKLHLDPESTEETATLTESQLVDFLEQTLEILKVVHFNKIIHRDIKPSNLIWRSRINNNNEETFEIFLIDFGCVKEIDKYIVSSNQGVPSSVVIGTPFYMPLEQDRKEPQFNTDIYALGWVAIQAVTGLKTNQENIRSIWQEKANIKDDLKLILAQMIHPECKKPEEKSKERLGYRYQTASDILEDLRKLKKGLPVAPLTQIDSATPGTKTITINPPERKSDKWAKWLGILFGLILLGTPLWIAWEIWFKPRVWQTSNKASIGEEVYFETGQECTDEVRDKKYTEAKKCFGIVMSKNLNNPETAIYYNNSLALDTNKKPYYLAAVVPISTNQNLANEILRGVAHAQHLFNKQGGVDGRQLVVVIADDANNKDDQAIDVAKLLRDENKIVGIIGHNSTTATKAAIQEYKQKNYPWISPTIAVVSSTSSGNDLNNKGEKDQFFRATLSDEVVVKKLTDYLNDIANVEKVAVFYDSSKDHPISAKQTLIENLGQNKVINAEDLNINEPNFFHLDNIDNTEDANKIVETLVANNIQHVALFPDVSNFQCIQSISRAIENIPEAQSLKIYGVTPLYNPETIQNPVVGNLMGLEGMILALDWARDMPSATSFLEDFKGIWESKNSLISWRTATSYDATQVFIKAFSSDRNSRSSILNYLQNGFSLDVEKTSGKDFVLDADGNRDGEPIFVELVAGSQNNLEFKFKCEQIEKCK